MTPVPSPDSTKVAASGRRLLAAPDSFKGTASASEVAAAVAGAASELGWDTDECPLSDGGEGFLEIFARGGGELRRSVVTGPLGHPVQAEWRMVGDLAVVESARASGLVAAGGAEHNDPVAATSRGTGELVAAAVGAGAMRVIVGVGGSAMTDGGLGALEAIDEAGGLGGAEVLVACDVKVRFVEAARVFGPQKGASPVQVDLLEDRLKALANRYRRRGVDLTDLPGAGAAGGLAGGLVVAGARIERGFDLVAGLLDLRSRIREADLVITGEGAFDATSFEGKVVSGVAGLAAESATEVVVIAGRIDEEALRHRERYRAVSEAVDLTERFGRDRAMTQPATCVATATGSILSNRVPR